jgi:hypothetical protein
MSAVDEDFMVRKCGGEQCKEPAFQNQQNAWLITDWDKLEDHIGQ